MRSGESFIKVYDFNTGTFLDPIELPTMGSQLIPLDDNKLLAIQQESYVTIDTKTLATSDPVTAYVGSSPAALDRANNKLY